MKRKKKEPDIAGVEVTTSLLKRCVRSMTCVT